MKPCPRCGGNLQLEKYDGIWWQNCLQCGYDRELIIPKPSSSAEEIQAAYEEQVRRNREKKRQEMEKRNELIRDLTAAGWTTRELTKKFKLSGCNIMQIVARNTTFDRREKAACQNASV